MQHNTLTVNFCLTPHPNQTRCDEIPATSNLSVYTEEEKGAGHD